MRAGRLRHWLRFERLVEEQHSDGAMHSEWVRAFDTGSEMPAEITPASGREFQAAQAVQAEVTHRLKIRFRAGIVAKMRAVTMPAGVIYNIEAVLPDMDSGRRYLTLMATAGVNEG